MDRAGTPDGIVRITAQPGAEGKTKVTAKATGPLLSGRPFGLPTPQLSPPLTLQLQAEHGACFETNYLDGGVMINNGATGQFRARGQ